MEISGTLIFFLQETNDRFRSESSKVLREHHQDSRESQRRGVSYAKPANGIITGGVITGGVITGGRALRGKSSAHYPNRPIC
jgi:hypothetical protein